MIVYTKDIDYLLSLLDTLWNHSGGYSEDAEEWWEDAWYKEDSYDEFCNVRDEAEDRLRKFSNEIKALVGKEDSALWLDENQIEIAKVTSYDKDGESEDSGQCYDGKHFTLY